MLQFPYVKLPRVELEAEEIESLKREAEMVLEEETENYKTCRSTIPTYQLLFYQRLLTFEFSYSSFNEM